MPGVDHRYASLDDLAKGLHARRYSATELTRATLEALAAVGPRFNAIANLTPERAMAEARRADRRLASRERASSGPASALLGVPYGAKDIFAAVGAPTTWGAPEFRDQRFDEDATVIARLARRGAVLAGKLASVELAGGGRPLKPGASLQGQGRNVWDPTRYSGGSSSGPGIAVAAGLVPYALGSETGGSILGPASYSGITGLRPTYGLIPRTGVMALSWTMDKVGILARSARDIAIVLGAIAGPDGRDASAAGRFASLDSRRPRAAVKRVRIGFAGEDVEQCDPVMHRRLAAGLDELQRIVPRFTPAAIRSDLPYTATLELVLLAEAATIFAEHLEAPTFDLVDERQKAELRSGLEIKARDYLQGMRVRELVAEDFRRVFREVDVIVSAGRSETAPWLDRIAKKRTSATVPDRLRSAANLAGVPGVFFPVGLADDGMPAGLQLVGPPRSEPLLLAIAEAFQSETDHHLARPPHA